LWDFFAALKMSLETLNSHGFEKNLVDLADIEPFVGHPADPLSDSNLP